MSLEGFVRHAFDDTVIVRRSICVNKCRSTVGYVFLVMLCDAIRHHLRPSPVVFGPRNIGYSANHHRGIYQILLTLFDGCLQSLYYQICNIPPAADLILLLKV